MIGAYVDTTKYEVRKNGQRLAPGTYFVLRSSDKFAYAALWQYAQVLQLGLELQTAMTEEEKTRLRGLQIMVEGMAESWQAVSGKLPD